MMRWLRFKTWSVEEVDSAAEFVEMEQISRSENGLRGVDSTSGRNVLFEYTSSSFRD
jgi:hypothetical protein